MKKNRLTGRILSLLLMTIVALSLIVGCGSVEAKSSKKNRQETTVSQENTAKNNTDKKSAEKETGKTGTDKKKTGKDKDDEDREIKEDEEYTSKEDVAEYLHLYEHLPDNYITKNEAKKLGWVSSKGNLRDVAPGKSIGGDRFGNNEGLLPKKKNRQYYECDIDFDGKYRNAKRIIYSDDGLIYYTEDHYETFELLYGDEED